MGNAGETSRCELRAIQQVLIAIRTLAAESNLAATSDGADVGEYLVLMHVQQDHAQFAAQLRSLAERQPGFRYAASMLDGPSQPLAR